MVVNSYLYVIESSVQGFGKPIGCQRVQLWGVTESPIRIEYAIRNIVYFLLITVHNTDTQFDKYAIPKKKHILSFVND